MSKRRVAYYLFDNACDYEYCKEANESIHPMQPFRLELTNELVYKYGLNKKMVVLKADGASKIDMTQFHSEDYIDYLCHYKLYEKNITKTKSKAISRYNIYDDNGYFKNAYEFCSKYTGASISAARKINQKEADICINWAGGLHHALHSLASGFCFVNDAVLCIMELLKFHSRVLYLDIDCHHGDGVSEAFFLTNRVMNVSFHAFEEDFFPETGSLDEIGYGLGKKYNICVPLLRNCSDDSYLSIFKPVMRSVMERFRPEAIVMQCGADSLGGDRIGILNLSTRGHGECVKFIKSRNTLS